jgi:hypothetical protein
MLVTAFLPPLLTFRALTSLSLSRYVVYYRLRCLYIQLCPLFRIRIHREGSRLADLQPSGLFHLFARAVGYVLHTRSGETG